MNQPPERPWIKGVQPEYRMFSIVVNVLQDNDGNLWSEHDLEGQQDQDTCDTLPTKGLEQSSFGLFCESIRRESFLQAVLWFSENPAMLDAYRNGDPKVQADIESALSSRTRAAFDRSLYRTIAGASKEILHLLGAADEPE